MNQVLRRQDSFTAEVKTHKISSERKFQKVHNFYLFATQGGSFEIY